MTTQSPLPLFKEKAEKVSIHIAEAASMRDAIMHTVNLCKDKSHFEQLLSADSPAIAGHASPASAEQKIIAAPGLGEADFLLLKAEGEKEGFAVINNDLRACLAGLDVTLSIANMGIAETATAVLDCTDEDLRLASMLCEDHVIILPKSAIKQTLAEVEDALNELHKNGPRFISFISGCSRTSDIERVLTLGVHGPLDLHILLLDA